MNEHIGVLFGIKKRSDSPFGGETVTSPASGTGYPDSGHHSKIQVPSFQILLDICSQKWYS